MRSKSDSDGLFPGSGSLDAGLSDLRENERRFRDMIDALPAAVFTTDADGRLTHFNPAAVEFSGRVPELGTDEWCSGWRMYRVDGTPLPYDECPMCVALREGRAIHGEEAVAERADGSRVWFAAYPRALRSVDGRVIGGIHMLIDISDRKRAEQANARLAAIVESSDDAIVGKNLDGIITNWNPAAERLFGYTSDEVVGRSITIIIPPDRVHEEATILGRIRRGERVQHYETVRRRRDGTLLDISLSVSPITDSTGRVIGASKIARDITSQKLAERARGEEVLLRETLSRVAATLTAELDEAKVVQTIVEAGATLTGAECGGFFERRHTESGESFALSTVSGRFPQMLEAFPQSDDAGVFAPVFRGEKPVLADDLADDLADANVHSCLGVPIRSRTGDVLGALFFVHSQRGHFLPRHEQLVIGIASSAAVALDNARLYRQAQEASRVKDEFLATLSHELRTPLNAMLGWSQMLRTATLPPETQRRALESLERNAKAQAQLVEDLLDVSRIVSGKLQVKFDEVDISRIVADAGDSVRPGAAAKGLDLRVSLPPGTMVIVRGDAVRLRQVVWNLLSNATKFTAPGGRIDVEVHVVGSKAQIRVRDTGEGIAPQFLPHVFERFWQAESTVSRRHGGLGLGLAIVRHLTEAHGGTVGAESPGEGKGATFTVTLPIFAVSNEVRATVVVPRVEPAVLTGIRVLVVDDQPDARELARVVLELHGAEVSTVASAGEALHAVSGCPFDVLIADIGMPEQDGYALIQAVRALPGAVCSIPAIAATAYASVHERARALDAGYGWHLAKPLDPEQLIAAVLAARSIEPKGSSLSGIGE